LTSACTSVGIEELFVSLGSKYLDPNYNDDDTKKPSVQTIDSPVNPPNQEGSEQKQEEVVDRNQSIKLSPLKKNEKKKGKCC
jgi:hypothetical protein